MKLGITSYAYRWAVGGDTRFGDSIVLKKPMNPFDLVRKTSELGLEVVQICENVDLNMSNRNFKNLGKIADDLNVMLELGATGMDMTILKRCVIMAELAHAHLVRVYPTEKEPVSRLTERLRDFLPILRSKGLVLAIENSSLWLYSSRQLATIFRKVDSPLIGACIDVVNSIGLLEKPLETVRILAPYAVSLHIKDYRIERKSVSGFTIFGVPLGTGMLNVKAVLETVKRAGREPNILIEQFMDKKGNIQETFEEEERWVKEGIKYLKSFL